MLLIWCPGRGWSSLEDEDDDGRLVVPENSNIKSGYKKDQVSVKTITFLNHHSTVSFRYIHAFKHQTLSI
jgi:hypothetical protein